MSNNNAHCWVSEQKLPGTRYDVYLSDEIVHPNMYRELLDVLRTAGAEDEVHIHLNTPGGYMYTAVQIMQHMANCHATIIGHLDGVCHSAGTFIFLCCDGWTVSGLGSMLVHNASAGFVGKLGETLEHARATEEWCERIAEIVYSNFLTKKELKKLKDDKDFWLKPEDIMKRLKNFHEARDEIVEELKGN